MRNRDVRDTLSLISITALSLAMLGAGYGTWHALNDRPLSQSVLDAATLERLTGVALGLLGALALVWLLLCLGLALLARLAAACGQAHHGAAMAPIMPAFLARLMLAGFGGSLVLAGCSATAAPLGTGAGAVSMAPHRPQPVGAGHIAHRPDSQPPAVTVPPEDGTVLLSPGFIPHRVPLPLARLAGGTTRAPDEVVVGAGDSLWTIAARHLPTDAGPEEIADAWPLWYEANRLLIGPDPNLLEIGWVLRIPQSDSAAS